MKPHRLPIEPTEEEIRHEAFLLWEKEGRPPGRDREIWFAARERLRHSAPAPHGLARRARTAVPFARDAQPSG
jgi:hypothetical protein